MFCGNKSAHFYCAVSVKCTKIMSQNNNSNIRNFYMYVSRFVYIHAYIQMFTINATKVH